MQNIWAATDKPVIDRMKSRNSPLLSKMAHNQFTSSDDSSDSDCPSEVSFLAVPAEFRPKTLAKQSMFSQRNGGTNSLSLETSQTSDFLKHEAPQHRIVPNDTPTKNNVKKNSNRKHSNDLQKTNRTVNNNCTAQDERHKNVMEVIFPKEKNGCLRIVDETGISEISVQDTMKKQEDSKLAKNVNTETFKDKKRNVSRKIGYEIKHGESVTLTESNFTASNGGRTDIRTIKNGFTNNTEIQKDTGAKPKNKNMKRNRRPDERKFHSENHFQKYQTHKQPIKWDSTLSLDNSKIYSQELNPPKNEVLTKKIEWTINQTRILEEDEMSDQYFDATDHADFNYSKNFPEKGATKEQSHQIKYKNTQHNLSITNMKLSENKSSKFNVPNNRLKNDIKTNRNNRILDNSLQGNFNKYTTAEDIYNAESQFSYSQAPVLKPYVNKNNTKLPLIVLLDNNNKQLSSINVSEKNADTLVDKSPIINFGKDVSNLVIGSHIAFSTLFSIYTEWKKSRNELIKQFQQLENEMQASSQQYQKYKDLLRVGKGAIAIAAAISHPYVSMASKIVSAITGLVSTFFSSKDETKIDIDAIEIKTLLLKDIENSSELYMHGLQCNMQFQETRSVIEDFHTKVNFSRDKICLDMITFIQGVLEYSPKHNIFYKKLHKCYKDLLEKHSLSPYSKPFCEPFSLYNSDAIDVIQYLDWKFIEFDNVSVENELKEIPELIQNSNGLISVKELASKIKKCVRILNDGLEGVHKCMLKIPLFEDSTLNTKLK